MENKTTMKTGEAMSESARLTGKWVNDTGKTLMDLYNRQFDLLLGYYSSLLNSFSGMMNRNGGQGNGLSGSSHNGNDGHRSLFSPFFSYNPWAWMARNNRPYDSFFALQENMIRRAAEYNKAWMSAIEKGFRMDGHGQEPAARKLQTAAEEQMKTLREAGAAVAETAISEMEFCMKANKQLLDELSDHLYRLMKSSAAIWTDTQQEHGQKEETGERNERRARHDRKEVHETA